MALTAHNKGWWFYVIKDNRLKIAFQKVEIC